MSEPYLLLPGCEAAACCTISRKPCSICCRLRGATVLQSAVPAISRSLRHGKVALLWLQSGTHTSCSLGAGSTAALGQLQGLTPWL